MSIRHPFNPVFPVVLTSSIVFSILSLPFFLYHSQIDAASSNFYEGFQPVVESKNRDLTIRYIGAAMVLSVVTGISTIEIQRKRQAQRTSAMQPSAEPNQEVMTVFADSTFFNTEFESMEPVGFAPAFLITESVSLGDAENA